MNHETLRSVFVKFPTPKPLTTTHTNAKGPIIGIELMTTVVDGRQESIYWADDGLGDDGGGPTAYMSLLNLCGEYGFNPDEIINFVARAFVEEAGSEL